MIKCGFPQARRLAVMVGAILMVGLAGCSLPWGAALHPATPQPNATASQFADKLIGVFVTTTPLNLAPDQRVSATVTPSNDVNNPVPNYTFEGLDGFAMFTAILPGGTSPYCHQDASLTDVTCVYSPNDENSAGGTSTSLTMTGTLNVTATSSLVLYGNPVLQASDDSVYVIKSDSPGFGSGSVGATETLSIADTRAINGITAYSAVITFNVRLRAEPSHITVLAMSDDDLVLSRTQYAPGTLPDAITPPVGTAYIMMNTEATDKSVTREILDTGGLSLVTYAARDDGVLIAHTTTINWP